MVKWRAFHGVVLLLRGMLLRFTAIASLKTTRLDHEKVIIASAYEAVSSI